VFAALAVLCTGIFAGAAAYVTLVEHPARIEGGAAFALAQFGPSYRRAAVMQASLAVVGCAPAEADGLLVRWARLHAVRSGLGLLAFLLELAHPG